MINSFDSFRRRLSSDGRLRITNWAVRPVISRAVSIGMIVSLLTTSTPSAPRVIVGLVKEYPASAALLQMEGPLKMFASVLKGKTLHKPKPQETQRARNAQVSRIQIYPGDTRLHTHQRAYLSAIPFDSKGVSIGGIALAWSVDASGLEGGAQIDQAGMFEASYPGTYRVKVEAAGKQAEVALTVANSTPKSEVKPVLVERRSQQRTRSEGSRSSVLSYADQKRIALNHSRRGSSSPQVSPTSPIDNDDPFGWQPGNFPAATDPTNDRGNPLGRSPEGNGNFRFDIPLLQLAGRGQDLGLSLSYNSRLWTKSGSEITFDIDKDWPAPGWSFNLGKMISMAESGTFIIDGDGTRHSFTGTITRTSSKYTFVGETTDGSFIKYRCVTSREPSTGNLYGPMGLAKYPDGKTVEYFGNAMNPANGTFIMVPIRIFDPNGNYISITYSAIHQSQRIETIKDSLGRSIIFRYDNNNSSLLTAIEAAGIRDQAGNSTSRTLVRLHYKSVFLDYSLFSGLTEQIFNRTISVIDAIYVPGTGNGYWFGDADSYSPYGMIRKIVQQRGMGFSTVSSDPVQSLREQGTVVPGILTSEQVYNYPQTAQSLGGPPVYDSMTQSWQGIDTTAPETAYLINNSSNPRSTTITRPDGTQLVRLSYNYSQLADSNPTKLLDGRVFQEELKAANGTVLRRSTTNWETGFRNAPRITRMELSELENGQNLMRAIAFDYEEGTYNQVMQVREYGLDNALMRTIKTVYTIKNDWDVGQLWSPGGTDMPRYDYSRDLSPRFLYLVASVEILSPDNTPASFVQYGYDETQLQNVGGLENQVYPFVCDPNGCSGVIQQEQVFNPYLPGYGEYGVYGGKVNVRGNVTSSTRYTDAASRTGPLTDQFTYDITGNLVLETTAGNLRRRYLYNQDTQFGYVASRTLGSNSDATARVTTSSTYDFNTGLNLSTTDANLRTSIAEYDVATWRPTKTTSASGAYTVYGYADSTLSFTESTYENNGTLAAKAISRRNGIGQVRRQERLSAVDPDVWDATETKFDKLGRTSHQSLPFPAGADPSTVRWVQTQYDDRGRVFKVIAGDGSATEMIFNELQRPQGASSELGLTVKRIDPWGRQRWWRSDSQEQIVEVIEPNPNESGSVATGGLQTTYRYDVLGNLIEANQGVQHRAFKYDSVGRLTHQKLAEANATLDQTGNLSTAGSGLWSDYFSYDERSNLSTRVDARGVKTTLSYLRSDGQPDPLNRLQAVLYDPQGAANVSSAANVSYSYVTAGDVTRVQSVTTSGIMQETFGYDTEGRIAERNVGFLTRPGQPMSVSYRYDSLNRPTDTIYPQQYGLPNDPRKTAKQSYDVASRIKGITLDQTNYASQIAYNAASQAVSLKVGLEGANQVTETYDYAPDTGLLSNQTVSRGTGSSAAVLLNLNYDYLLSGTTSGRTGQVTKVVNNLNHNQDRSYSYNALGQLAQAKGGPAGAPIWTQNYGYDPYGNRTSVSASGYSARIFGVQSDHQSAVATRKPELTNPSNPEIASLNQQLLSKADIELHDSLRTDMSSAISDSSFSPGLLPARANTTSQVGVPAFTDDPLVPGVTEIRALHITELRDAVDQARVRAGQLAANWEPIDQGWLIKATHILELRTRLDEARMALGLQPASYVGPPPSIGGEIKATHVQELRERVIETLAAPSSIPLDGQASLSFDSETNRITTTGFAYDATGNLTRALNANGAWLRYQYDAAGRLVKIKDDNSVTFESYTYAHSRQRVITQYGNDSSNQRMYYVWGTAGVIAEYSESQLQPSALSWSGSYIYLSSTLLATQEVNGTSESVQFHHPDSVGSRVITNAQTTASFEQVVLPFGTALSAESTGVSNRRFTSYDRSLDSKLDYAINRFYDSSQGRFTQVDSIGMQAIDSSNPQSLNLYVYCLNDPINATDTTGTDWFGITFRFPGFSGGGRGEGPSFGGFLGGLFSFGLGLLGSIFGGRNRHIIGPPSLGGSQRGATPPPVPTPATIAVHGVYGPAMEAWYPHSNEAFYRRARFSVGGDESKIRGFSTGAAFIDSIILLSNQVGTIGRLNAFFHSTAPGIVGFQNDDRGLYIDYSPHDVYTRSVNWKVTPYPLNEKTRAGGARGTNDFVSAILDGRINIANGGEIVLWGCNSDAMASHIQFLLNAGKRGDIRVTGATGKVTLENPTYADAVGRFNTYTGNNQLTGGTPRRRNYR
jgi:RHS repeat-associated protein